MQTHPTRPEILPDGLPDDFIKPGEAKKDPRTLRILSSVWGITKYLMQRHENGAIAFGSVIEISPKVVRISPSRTQLHLMERGKRGYGGE